MGDWLSPEVSFILYWFHSLFLAYCYIFWVCLSVLWPFFYGTHLNIQNLLLVVYWVIIKKWWFLVSSSMYVDRYCATESLSSLVEQHIPGATLLQQSDQQLVYSLPFKDMDKFSGITYFEFLGSWTKILCWESVFLIYFVVYFSA